MSMNEFFSYPNLTRFVNTSLDDLLSVQSYFLRMAAISKIITDMKISTVLKPFDQASKEDYIYRLYIQPVFFVFAFLTFILMAFYTRKDKCFKSYVLTVTFLLNDTIGILLPLPFHFAFLPPDVDSGGLSYKWCEIFRVFVVFLPQVFYYHSQWLKFAACIFECFSIYFPKRAKWFYRKRFLVTLLVTSLLVATVITSLMNYDIDFEKFVYLHRSKKIIVNTCILVPSPIYDVNSRIYNIIRIVMPMTIGIFLPFVCMAVGTIIIIVEIYQRSNSSDQQSRLCSISTQDFQHVRFVAITSIIFLVILLPRLVFEVLTIDEISRDLFYQTWTERFHLMSQIIYHATVPLTMIAYYAIKKMWKIPDEGVEVVKKEDIYEQKI